MPESGVTGIGRQCLKTLIHCSKYCGLCLETNDELLCPIEAKHFVAGANKNIFTLKEILFVLFGYSIESILLSGWICKLCKMSAINSYVFITKAKQNGEIYTELINQMEFKLNEISHYAAINQNKSTTSKALMVLKAPESYELISKTLCNQLKDSYNLSGCEIQDAAVPTALILRKIKKSDSLDWKDSTDHSIKLEPEDLKPSEMNWKDSTDHSIKLEPEDLKPSEMNWKDSTDHSIKLEPEDLKPSEMSDDNNLTCAHCKKNFLEKRYLKKHMLQFHSNITIDNACSVCKKKFSTKKKLLKHLQTHKPNERHKCDLCSVDFRNRSQYIQHTLSAIHRSRLRPEQRKFLNLIDLNCSICQLQCNGVKHLKHHLATHDPNSLHRCVYCNLEFATRSEYKKHARKISHKKKQYPEKILKCNYCKYTAYYKRNLKAHIAKHPKDQLNKVTEVYVCHICSKKFKYRRFLDVHLRRHAIVQGKVEEKRYEKTCHICGKVYCGPSSIKKHMRLHTGERPYKCEICNEGFVGASDRNIHVLRKHTEKSISCPLCQTRFHTRTNLRSHVRKVHWKRQEKFDYTKLEGLSEEDYKLFCDRRKVDYIKCDS